MTSLYQIQSDYLEVLRAIADPEVPEDMVGAYLDTKEMLEDERDAKLNSLCGYAHVLSDELDCIDKEIKRLRGLKERVTAGIERLEKYAGLCLDYKPWKSTLHKITFGVSTAVVPTEDNVNAEVPEQYARIKREPDKVLLGNDLKLGATIPGWKLETRKNVRIS